MHKQNLIHQVFEKGTAHLHNDFIGRYGDLFDNSLKDKTGLGKPEAYDPLILEIRNKVVGFSLPSILMHEGAINMRVATMPNEIADYICDMPENSVGSSLINWIDPELPYAAQCAISEIMQNHMMKVFEKSPAQIVLNACLNYNPNGATIATALHRKNGHSTFAQADDHFFENIEQYNGGDALLEHELKIKARSKVILKGLTIASRAKIEQFEQRYDIQNRQTKAMHS